MVRPACWQERKGALSTIAAPSRRVSPRTTTIERSAAETKFATAARSRAENARRLTTGRGREPAGSEGGQGHSGLPPAPFCGWLPPPPMLGAPSGAGALSFAGLWTLGSPLLLLSLQPPPNGMTRPASTTTA